MHESPRALLMSAARTIIRRRPKYEVLTMCAKMISAAPRLGKRGAR